MSIHNFSTCVHISNPKSCFGRPTYGSCTAKTFSSTNLVSSASNQTHSNMLSVEHQSIRLRSLCTCSPAICPLSRPIIQSHCLNNTNGVSGNPIPQYRTVCHSPRSTFVYSINKIPSVWFQAITNRFFRRERTKPYVVSRQNIIYPFSQQNSILCVHQIHIQHTHYLLNIMCTPNTHTTH